MANTVTKMQLKRVLSQLDSMELQILKLKSSLLLKVKASKKELAVIEASEKDIRRGLGIKGKDFVNELTR